MSFNYQVYYPILDAYGGPLLVVSFALLLFFECKRPLRKLEQKALRRFFTNAIVSAPAVIAMRLALIPALMVAAAYAEQSKFGLLHLVDLPMPLQFVSGFVFLDYLLYVWHILSHKVPLLWRFHNVHHTDRDLTVSTGIRFHFGEMLLSGAFRTAGVLLIGVAPSVILIYEVVFEMWVAFQHSNWRLPLWLERGLILLFVTPRMHGIHHSNIQAETNSNFSNFLNVWDRIHGTLRLNVPQESIVIGVPAYSDEDDLSVTLLLSMPFKTQRDYWQTSRSSARNEIDSSNKSFLAP